MARQPVRAKNLLLLSVSGFTVSSVLCGLAPSLPMLIPFRRLQGATGGAMQPLSRPFCSSVSARDRGKAKDSGA
jgi:DHA2 family multidrug resistance protein